MQAMPGLNAGLLIGRDDKFICLEWLPLPLTLVEVQHPASFGGEIRVARENPAAMLPGANRVFMQPPPQGGSAQLCHQATLANMAC